MIWTKMFIEAHIPTYPCEKIEHSLVHKGFLASAPDFTFAVLSVENLRTSEFTWKKTCCQTTPNNGFQVWKHQRVSGPSWNAQKWNKKYLIENLLELKFAANHQMCMRNVVALWSFVSTRCPKDMLRCNQIMWQGYFIFSISEFGKVHAQNTSANYFLPKNYAIFQYFFKQYETLRTRLKPVKHLQNFYYVWTLPQPCCFFAVWFSAMQF